MAPQQLAHHFIPTKILVTVEFSSSSDAALQTAVDLAQQRPLVFGSIAEKIVKQVPCPSLLLRSVEPAATCATSTPQS
jgi:nucleotide-binding universal stress UspA family protein